jgi:hypothetical protein
MLEGLRPIKEVMGRERIFTFVRPAQREDDLEVRNTGSNLLHIGLLQALPARNKRTV